MSLSQTIWSTKRRKAATTLISCLTIIVMTHQVYKAAPDFEPATPALHGWVRSQLKLHGDTDLQQIAQLRNEVVPPMNRLLLWREEDNKQNAENQITKWQQGLKTEADPQIKALAREELEKLNRYKSKVEKRIETLKALPGNRSE